MRFPRLLEAVDRPSVARAVLEIVDLSKGSEEVGAVRARTRARGREAGAAHHVGPDRVVQVSSEKTFAYIWTRIGHGWSQNSARLGLASMDPTARRSESVGGSNGSIH